MAFVIVPIFAFANTGILLSGNWIQGLTMPNSLGILFGLILGKPIGIFIFSYLAVKLKLSQLPNDVNWKHILGAGFLGGIGFTMSIFITLLAFENASLIQSSKISILLASLIAGSIGFLILKQQATIKNNSKVESSQDF